MSDKKPVVLKYSADDITNLRRADFLETVDKQEMVSVGELSKAMTAEDKYLKQLFIAVDKGKKSTEGDFYIEVVTNLELINRKARKTKFIVRKTCAPPLSGSAVYKFTRKEEKLDLLWVLPVKRACEFMYRNRLNINPVGTAHAMQYILDYYDGTLLKIAQKENGELV